VKTYTGSATCGTTPTQTTFSAAGQCISQGQVNPAYVSCAGMQWTAAVYAADSATCTGQVGLQLSGTSATSCASYSHSGTGNYAFTIGKRIRQFACTFNRAFVVCLSILMQPLVCKWTAAPLPASPQDLCGAWE
jgi:hypothetical protein